MQHRDVELLAVGAGPGNLALAVALEEEPSAQLATGTLIIEQHDGVAWQRGMLLPWSVSQVSFLKDLVTRRNPRSAFSFINYLHSVDRLDDFINLGSFLPYRLEISGYLRWVAASLQNVRIEYGRRCVAIEPVCRPGGQVTDWIVSLADGTRIRCAHLVIGAGRDPYIPEQYTGIPRERVIHSTEFTHRVAELDAERPYRFVVVGGAQSAAEMVWAAHQAFPHAHCTMLMRSIGLQCYESSKFTNELYYPSFVDQFHAAAPDAREQLLREMHRTNYSGLAPDMLDTLYRQVYLEKLTGSERLGMLPMTEVIDARMDDAEVVLSIVDRMSGTASELRCDRVLLGTGFVKAMPKMVRDLADAVGLADITVTRGYGMQLPAGSTATCHLQGVNEATHGIADSLLSVLASRSEEIVTDILAQRATAWALKPIPIPR